MFNAIRPLAGFLGIVLLASTVWANNNNAVVTSSLTIQEPKKEGRRWSGFADISRSTSLYDFQDGSRRDGMDYSMRLNYKISNLHAVRLQGGYSQDLNYPESDDFADSSLGFLRVPTPMGDSVSIGYTVSAVIPTSKESKKGQNLQTAVSGAINLAVNPDKLITGLSINGALSVGRNFHEYETTLSGRVNNQYSSRQTLMISYGFLSSLSLSATFSHRNAWSYQNVMRDSFEFAQDFSYQVNPTWSVTLGHTNSGSTLKPNGFASNVELFNENNSIAYGSLTVIF